MVSRTKLGSVVKRGLSRRTKRGKCLQRVNVSATSAEQFDDGLFQPEHASSTVEDCFVGTCKLIQSVFPSDAL